VIAERLAIWWKLTRPDTLKGLAVSWCQGETARKTRGLHRGAEEDRGKGLVELETIFITGLERGGGRGRGDWG
jgi:hypothetical protein